ncbi:RNA polymerase sigma factor [Streptomyces filamentosus]|uniref:RNA polymerase sigma factor n=1 Tax=Streptomyces filamentosus TaxID=67294 RepID=UPI0037CF384D
MNSQASPKITQQDGTEPELLVRVRAGDPEAFATLYNDHQRALFRYVLARVQDPHTAEDVTQEVFLRAFRSRETFTWRGQVIRAWLHTIARNIIIDAGRAKSRRPEVVVGEIGEYLALNGSVPGPEDILFAGTAAQDQAELAMAALPQHHQQVVTMRFLKELSVPETAAALGHTTRAVQARTHKAMARMRRALGAAA